MHALISMIKGRNLITLPKSDLISDGLSMSGQWNSYLSSEIAPRRWTLDGEGGADRTLEWRRGFDMDVLLAAVLDSIGRRPSIPTTASADLPAGKPFSSRLGPEDLRLSRQKKSS